MISLQSDISYAGDATKAPLKAVNVSFQVPRFSYSGSVDAASSVVRTSGALIEAGTLSQQLAGTTYSVALAETFLTGGDDAGVGLACV